MSKYKYDATPDPYCYAGSNVLINKLGLKSAAELEDAERKYTANRMGILLSKPVSGRFGFTHLKNIHKAIFCDVYEWAGKTRIHGFISKDGTIFCKAEYINSEASRIFNQLASEKYLRKLPFDQFVVRLVYYASEINALHPFREGNGRATREYIRQLAVYNNYFIAWQDVSAKELLKADIAAFARDYIPLIAIYSRILMKRG
jgi:cell filamentation protein